MSGGNEFRHGEPAVDEVVWAAGEVGDGDLIGVDPELVVERGEDLAEVDAAVGDFATETVGGSDDVAGFHAAAGEEGAADLRPVVAAAVFVDLGGAAEFAPCDDGDVLVHTAEVEVFDESAEALIEEREVCEEFGVVGAVEVPAAEVECDAAGTGLDEASGDEEVFAVARGTVAVVFGIAFAVAFADGGGFAADVERVHETAGGEDIEGFLGEAVGGFDCAAGVDVAAEAVEAGEEGAAVAEALEGDVIEFEVFGAWAAVRAEGGVGHAEVAGVTGGAVGRVTGFGGEADEGWDGGVGGAVEFRDDGPHGGPAAGWLFGDGAAGVADEGIVVAAGGTVHGADGDEFVHDPCAVRHVFGDVDAGDVSAGGTMGAADLDGSVHFEIDHVLMRRGTGEVDHDDRLMGAFDAGEFLGGEHLREGETTEGEATDAEHVTAGDSVAEAPGGRTEEVQHGIGDAMVSEEGCGKFQCVPLCVGREVRSEK